MLQKQSRSLLKIIDEYISDYELKKMMRWRIANQRYYAEQPNITFYSFKKWFQDSYIKQRRILFWVVGKNCTKIGHMGLFQMENDSCEIDNVVRGSRFQKGIMGEALQELIVLARRMFKDIYLKVLADNNHAIVFYRRNGFVPLDKVLYKNKLFLKMKYENSGSK